MDAAITVKRLGVFGVLVWVLPCKFNSKLQVASSHDFEVFRQAFY
jgi:hypothetical protein